VLLNGITIDHSLVALPLLFVMMYCVLLVESSFNQKDIENAVSIVPFVKE
jgi:hypothetical protein